MQRNGFNLDIVRRPLAKFGRIVSDPNEGIPHKICDELRFGSMTGIDDAISCLSIKRSAAKQIWSHES